jgi:hypothetical protein
MLPEADLLRFTSFINYTDSCWLWTGSKVHNGYGHFKLNGRNVLAHRVALEIHLGRPLAAGMFACHVAHAICGNRHCCNPQHLREATRAENAADRIADGTAAQKLTASDVLAIRVDPRTQKAIAADYGITQVSVSHIKRGKSWAHLL